MITLATNTAWKRDLTRAGTPLQQWQNEQWNAFIAKGFPTRRDENWKYTDVSAIASQAFAISNPAHETKISEVRPSLDQAYTFIFVNGRFRSDLSRLSNLANRIHWTTIASAVEQDQSWLTHLSALPEYQTPFLLLNDALFSEGFILNIPDNVQLDAPIHFIYITEGANQPMMTHHRQWIRVGKNAQVTLFEEYRGESQSDYFSNIVTQVMVENNAQLTRYKWQHEGPRVSHIANTIIHQKRDSQVMHTHITTGASFGRDDLNFSLDESGVSTTLWGLTHLQNHQQMDCHSRVDHRVPYGTSQQYYNALVGDHSRFVFNGKVVVHPHAKKTKAAQSNKNLLLSAHAEVDTKPELEIYHDDVQCAHGATVGELDKQLIAYLQSRTLDKPMAQQLLIQAFADEIMSALPASVVTDWIQKQVSAYLNKEEYHV